MTKNASFYPYLFYYIFEHFSLTYTLTPRDAIVNLGSWSWSGPGLIIVKIGSMSILIQSQDLPFLDKEVKGPELTLKSQCICMIF